MSHILLDRPTSLSTIERLICSRFAKSIGGKFELTFHLNGDVKTAVVITPDKIGFIQKHKDKLFCVWKDQSGYVMINRVLIDMVFDEYKILSPDHRLKDLALNTKRMLDHISK